MILCGVDVSSSFIAEVYWNPEKDDWHFAGTDIDNDKLGNIHEKRMWRVGRAFSRGKAIFKCNLMMIELPMGQPGTVGELGRCTGAFMAGTAYSIWKPQVNGMGPSEWRKKAGMKGNCSKDEVRAAMAERYPPVSGMRQDFADAMALAVASLYLVQ